MENKNSSILISIVVPIYNIESYVESCAESILKQDHENIELLLVDDGSCDRSAEICDRIAASDSRVKVFHKPNGGLSDARNFGLEHSSGTYIMFIDGDDTITPDACSRLLADAVAFDADTVIGHCNYRKANSMVSHWEESVSQNFEYHKVYTGKEYLYKCLTTSDIRMEAWRNLFRKSFLIDNGLKFKFGIFHEDEEFTPRMLLAAERVVLSDVHFYYYDNMRTGSIMTTKNMKKAYDRMEIYDSLAKIYKNVRPKKLRRRLLDNICWKYLDCVANYDMISIKGFVPKRMKVLRYAYTPKRRLKALCFAVSPRLYCKLIGMVFK